MSLPAWQAGSRQAHGLIGCGDDDGVDIFAVEDLAIVLVDVPLRSLLAAAVSARVRKQSDAATSSPGAGNWSISRFPRLPVSMMPTWMRSLAPKARAGMMAGKAAAPRRRRGNDGGTGFRDASTALYARTRPGRSIERLDGRFDPGVQEIRDRRKLRSEKAQRQAAHRSRGT